MDQWTPRHSPAHTNTLNAVTFGANGFVAVGEKGTILTSPDGEVWTPQQSGSTNTLSGIACGNGLYVAVGNDTIITSPNGTAWSAREFRQSWEAPRILNAVIYANGAFVTVGSVIGERSVYYAESQASRDGLLWQRGLIQGMPPLLMNGGVAYGNGVFVATGNALWTTDDHLDSIYWSLRFHWAGGLGPYDTRSITFGGGKFVMAGIFGSLLVSTNVVDWKVARTGWQSNTTNRYTHGFCAVTFGSGHFVAVGQVSPAPGTVAPWIMTSSDTQNWITRASFPAEATFMGYHFPHGLKGVTFGNDTLVAVGWGGIIFQSGKVIRTEILTGETGFLPNGSFRLVVRSAASAQATIESSDDLSAWTALTTVTNSTGTAEIFDPADGGSRRFYRARSVLP